MTYQVRTTRPYRAFLAPALLAAGLAVLSSEVPAEAGGTGVEVDAQYKVSLNGFNIGSLHYTSAIQGNVYTLTSDVELSMLLGAFHWKGLSRTVGTVQNAALAPTGFNFDFESTVKNGSVRMGFDKSTVKTVSVEPAQPPAEGIVPVKSEHLKNVLDPLSAIMALTRGTNTNPCARKVAIFDGKQRFDLQLAFRRIEPASGPGQSPGTVCAIKYIPIAGYKASPETTAMASNSGIEITFRPAANADLLVPSRVVLPTMAGQAEIVAERVGIRGGSAGQVAFIAD